MGLVSEDDEDMDHTADTHEGSEMMLQVDLSVGSNEEVLERPRIVLPLKKRKQPEQLQKKKRTKNSTVSQRQCKLDFPPCRVCLGKGSGLHYGVNSCESCKSFFRRCLTRKEEYKCAKGWNCEVTAQARGNCSGCRYLRCIQVGMSREAACLGRYTLSRRTKTIMEAKGETSPSPSVSSIEAVDSDLKVEMESVGRDSVPATPSVDSDSAPGSVESAAVSAVAQSPAAAASGLCDMDLVHQLVNAMAEIKPFRDIVTEEQIKHKLQEGLEKYQSTAQVFGKMKAVPKDEYFSLLESTGIDIDGRQEFLRQSALSIQPVLHSYIAFANLIPGFPSLSLEDQCSLLKASHFEFILLLTYKGYDRDKQMILTETGNAYHIDQAADIFYSRDLINTIFDVCKKIQLLELTKEETSFLLAIAVTFGDRCQLENASAVDELQLNMIQMLRTYLIKSRGSEASRWFTKAVDCFIAMRAVGEKYLKEYGVICQDKMVQKEAPIWLALI